MIGALKLGIGGRSTALLETTGRRTGRRRVTPVTNGLEGDRFWRLEDIAKRNPRARANTNIVRKTGTDLTVVRIDLK